MAIYVDADASLVKEEVYRVARRYGIPVLVVANTPIRVPQEELIEFVSVADVSTSPTTGSPSGPGGRTS